MSEFNEPTFAPHELEGAQVIEQKPEAQPEKKPERAVAAPLVIDRSSQRIVVADNSELVRVIKIMMEGKALPATLDTQAKVIAAWQMAASLKLPPAVAIQNMAVIHGSVCMWGQLPKALAEATGQMEDFKLILFDDAQKVISLENKNLNAPVWGAVVQMRRTRRSMNEYSFTTPEAEHAGLLKKSGPWRDYRKIMFARRTMGHAVKFEFPDAVMGCAIAEYDFHEAPDIHDVTSREGLREAARSKIDGVLKGGQNG